MTLPASHDERKPNNGVGWMVTANWLCNTNTAVHGEREPLRRSYQHAKLRHISLPVREAKTCQNFSMNLLIPREDLFRNLHFKELGQRENNFLLARTRIQSLYSDILYHMYLYCGVTLLFFKIVLLFSTFRAWIGPKWEVGMPMKWWYIRLYWIQKPFYVQTRHKKRFPSLRHALDASIMVYIVVIRPIIVFGLNFIFGENSMSYM